MTQHLSSPTFPRLAKRSPNEEREYVIQALDGPAAGCTLTHNSDRRDNFSDWVHTQPTSGQGRYDKWQIQKYEAEPHPIYKIKAINNKNGENIRCTIFIQIIIQIYIVYNHELKYRGRFNFP